MSDPADERECLQGVAVQAGDPPGGRRPGVVEQRRGEDQVEAEHGGGRPAAAPRRHGGDGAGQAPRVGEGGGVQ